MESEFLRAPSVLYDLQNYASEESAISSLTTLSEIISSSQDEIEFLYNSGGITVIMSFLENDSNLVKICLKILATSSKRDDKIRKLLLENNIFWLLAAKLQKETDFSKSILILYSALIVVLVREDNDAQDQMHTSQCLSSLVNILSSILDEADHKPVPSKNALLIIYSIVASYKNPRHSGNQTEAGRITPKILEYLEKQLVYSDSDQLQLAKYFWFLLRTVLDKNEVNQQIFHKYSGFSLLFRSLQEVTELKKWEKIEELLVKITGVLVKLKSHKEFLSQASNYCPVMILCNVLKTRNLLVNQQIIIFLDSLTRECPQSLQHMQSTETLKQIEQAEAVLINSKTGKKLCRDLWHRVESSAGVHNSQGNFSALKQISTFLTLPENLYFQEIPGTEILKNHFCVVHGTTGKFADYPETFSNREKKGEAMKSDGREVDLRKVRSSGTDLNIRKQSRGEKQKLRRLIMQSFSLGRGTNPFNNLGLAGRKIIQICKTFLCFFTKARTELFNNSISY